MAPLSAFMRLSPRSLTRSTYRTPYTPPTRFISIPTTFNRPPPSFRIPPARRRLEPAQPTPPARLTGDKDKSERPRIERRPINRQIPFERVKVIDSETGKLSLKMQSLGELLAMWTKQGRVIELVASTPEPIVRVTTRSEVEAQYKEMKRALRRGARVGEEPKEVRLTWGVAEADVEHKLRKAKRDLEKGHRVAVVVITTKRHGPTNRQELAAFADEISKMLCGVGEECQERELTQRSITLSFRKAEQSEDVP